eukprot:Sspe_Gene.24025::Locus_9442_Transcript_1_1_Confidence_1.000_Length_1482::g.24025::m.24025
MLRRWVALSAILALLPLTLIVSRYPALLRTLHRDPDTIGSSHHLPSPYTPVRGKREQGTLPPPPAPTTPVPILNSPTPPPGALASHTHLALALSQHFASLPRGMLSAQLRQFTPPPDRPGACNATHALRHIDYTHRKARKGEVTTRGMLEMMHTAETLGVVLLSDPVNATVNPSPITFSTQYRIDVPFGMWKAVFADPPPRPDSPALREPQGVHWQPPSYVAVFRNAWVANGYAILCDRSFGSGGCLWHSPKGVPSKWTWHSKGATVCDQWCKGYFHWSVEHFPRVGLLAELLREDEEVKLVLPILSGFQREMLRVLGVRPSQLLRPASYRFSVLYHPQPQRCGNCFTPTLHILRREVLGQMSLPSASLASRRTVVLAERERLSRQPKNYPELKKALTARYRNLTFTSHLHLPVAQQLRLFNSAWIAFGPHGANLANIMFMTTGAHVIEMVPHSKGNLCYYSLATRVPLVYHIVPHALRNFVVDPDEVF